MTDNAPNPDCLFCDGEGVDADPYDLFDYPCYEACSGCWTAQKVGTTYGEAAAYDCGVRAGIAEERARIVTWLRDQRAVSNFYIDPVEAASAAICIETGEHLT